MERDRRPGGLPQPGRAQRLSGCGSAPELAAAGDSADHDSLVDVLAALPFNHRAAIVLRYYAGFTTEEIARALDCAPGSVGPWIDRGLTAMRKVL